MTKLEVFKSSATDLIAINFTNRLIREFIKDKKVVSAYPLNVGTSIFTYVWYEEVINIHKDIQKEVEEYDEFVETVSKSMKEKEERFNANRGRADKELRR